MNISLVTSFLVVDFLFSMPIPKSQIKSWFLLRFSTFFKPKLLI